jgi:hypothetical protein
VRGCDERGKARDGESGREALVQAGAGVGSRSQCGLRVNEEGDGLDWGSRTEAGETLVGDRYEQARQGGQIMGLWRDV